MSGCSYIKRGEKKSRYDIAVAEIKTAIGNLSVHSFIKFFFMSHRGDYIVL